MAREKGTFNFSANLEVKKQGPLDARQTMITYEELTQAATWQDESGKMYLFNGLIVPVTNGSDKQLYMLTDASKYNEPAYWKRIDAGAAVSEKEVYMIPGDPTSLNGESSGEDIKGVYGDLNTLKQAVADNKIITTKLGGAIHPISIGIEDVTITSMIYYSMGIMVQTITTAESDYVSIEVSGKQIPDASEFVQDVTAETSKGIEVTGTKENKKVGIKIDETTKGNVELLVGANGLKADFKKAPYFIGNIQSIIDNASQTISPNKVIAILGGNADALVDAINAKAPIFGSFDDGYIPMTFAKYEAKYFYFNFVCTYTGDLDLKYDAYFKVGIPYPEETGAMDSPTINLTVEKYGFPTFGNGFNYTKADGYVTIKPDNSGNVKLSTGTAGLKADFEESVKGVKVGDKVLKVESDKTISSTIGLAYKSETKKLQLTGIDEEPFAELDATPFIKDGMLDSATLETNPLGQDPGTYIKLVFNVDSGKEDPIYINVTSLIDVYTQGNGITISGKSISVKIDTAGNTENYLQLTAAGLKVTGVNQAITDAITEAFSWHDA